MNISDKYIKKNIVHVIRVRRSTKEDKPAGWQIVNRIKRCVKRRSKTRFFSSWQRSVNIGMQRMQAFCGLGWATKYLMFAFLYKKKIITFQKIPTKTSFNEERKKALSIHSKQTQAQVFCSLLSLLSK